MSKAGRESRQYISINELLIRANELREYINILQAQIGNYSTQLSELQLSLNTIENMPEEGGEALVTLDRLSTVYLPVTIKDNWKENIVVNIGLNYYIRSSKEKAKEIIRNRIGIVRKIIEGLRREYQAALTEYNALQQIIATVYARMQEQQSMKK
ncbi:MAG: prefoldin subunit alpha [Thermoprotei archaeon]|nr:MAG: prefoldin subunit alpha [Thermoprotei archaeon]